MSDIRWDLFLALSRQNEGYRKPWPDLGGTGGEMLGDFPGGFPYL